MMKTQRGNGASQDAEIDPRVARSMRIVREAALEELAEAGYGAFTIDAVSRRSGVARSTIYRHWPDKLALIGDALEVLNRQPAPRDDPGASPREQVTILLTHLTEVLRSHPIGKLIPALIAGAERDEAVAKFVDAYSSSRREALEAAIRRGVKAGSFRADVDPHLAAIALSGAVFYRRFMSARPLHPREIPRLIELVLGDKSGS